VGAEVVFCMLAPGNSEYALFSVRSLTRLNMPSINELKAELLDFEVLYVMKSEL